MRLLDCLLLAALAGPAGAASRSPALVVEAPPELAGVAVQVRALGRSDFAAARELVGLADPGPPIRVVLAPEGSELARHAPSWVSGYALPPLATIVLFTARVPSYPDRNLEALLQHEVAHVLIGRAVGFRPLPRWFDEGLATVAAREWGLEDRARYAMAVIGRGPRTTAELDGSFTGDDATVARAYALSSALVRYMLHRQGQQTAARILAAVATGDSFAQALGEVTGVGLPEWEAEFFLREAFWNTWVPFLTSSTALWMGITLLALLAIRKRRERDAALRERWALEEERSASRRLPTDEEGKQQDRLRIN